ncbi:hypothetical protein CHH28_13390 [Bacterioplanes sanyensis]|uniref:Uncharacterized protein n=1 Tax=Bacterioplanes sanyensis TaxID=1249553 RepID=A0A222FN04_9GAMM|nr:hypothetical protein [Bacterioplanes sanyensis]ASP39603.1 hypothetical protein CHH28_13390 [Bacterioplanes sanyensis]
MSISSIEVEGNAEYIFNGRTNIVQVHANIDDGEFIVEVDGQFGTFADRDAEIRLVFSDDNVSSRDLLEDSSAIYDGVIYDNLDDVDRQGLRTICQYESLSEVTCGGITIDLSEDETELPARMNLHALSCDAEINVCQYGAYVPIQLN